MKGLNNEPRDILLQMRVSASEMALVTKLQQNRKKIKSKRSSRTDVIVDAMRYADGQIIF